MRYATAVTWPTEQGRAGLIVCQACGASILLDATIPTMDIHDKWHDSIESRFNELESKHEYGEMHGPGGD